MKKLRFGLLIAIGFIFGAAAGWYVAERQYGKWAVSFAAAGPLSRLGDTYDALRALRRGDTNAAIEMLESRLDSETIMLAAVAPEETDAHMRGAYIRALARVRDYRVAHPRKSDSPETDQWVTDRLTSLEKKTQK